jgi:hypothetical protein
MKFSSYQLSLGLTWNYTAKVRLQDCGGRDKRNDLRMAQSLFFVPGSHPILESWKLLQFGGMVLIETSSY